MGKRLVTAAVLIPIVVAMVYTAPQWAFLFFVEIFLLAAVWELFQLMKGLNARGLPVNAILIASAPLLWSLSSDLGTTFVCMAPLVILAFSLRGFSDLRSALDSAALNVLGFFYLAVPFSLAVVLRGETGLTARWPDDLLIVFVAIWVADSAAFFVGRAIGKHRITPALSPNKSLEGFLAGLLFPALGMVWLAPLVLPGGSSLFLFLLGLTLGFAAIVGDLFESLLKRAAQVKDVSDLIPGHGGVLDRVDSLLFALPCYYVFYRIADWTGSLIQS